VDEKDFLTLPHDERVAQLAGESQEPLALQSTLAAAMGSCGNRPFLAVATDPAVTSGAIGVKEALELRRLIERARQDDLPLVLVIDSAGARVSEGVAIQGALRRLFAELLAARAAGLTTIAILGRNVFGGASMLAMSCGIRLYAANTRLAMTGPAVIQNHNSVCAKMVTETIAAPNRLEHDPQGTPVTDGQIATAARLREALQSALARRPTDFETWARLQDSDLRARLASDPARNTGNVVQVIDCDTVTLRGSRSAGPRDVVQLVDALQAIPPDCDRITLDCEWIGHSTQLADENLLLSQYLGYLCSVIHAIEARGTTVCLRIAGTLSGGLYIALAGAASEVRLAACGRVLTLPQDILDAFVQLPAAPDPDAAVLIEHGVIDTIET